MISAFKNKLTILATVLVLAAQLLVPAIASATDPDINNSLCAGTKVQVVVNPSGDACKNVTKNATDNANSTVKTTINLLSIIVGVLAVIMIIVAGFRYVTSGGSEEAVKGAKNTILYAIIGLVIVALAQIIVHFVLANTQKATNPPPPPPPAAKSKNK